MARVLLFGRLRDVAGWRDRRFDPDPPTLSVLRALVAADSPELAAALAAPGVQVAVDRALTRGEANVSGETEVAFMPAMSGG